MEIQLQTHATLRLMQVFSYPDPLFYIRLSEYPCIHPTFKEEVKEIEMLRALPARNTYDIKFRSDAA